MKFKAYALMKLNHSPKFKKGDLIRNRDNDNFRVIKRVNYTTYTCPMFQSELTMEYSISYIDSQYTLVTHEERAKLL